MRAARFLTRLTASCGLITAVIGVAAGITGGVTALPATIATLDGLALFAVACAPNNSMMRRIIAVIGVGGTVIAAGSLATHYMNFESLTFGSMRVVAGIVLLSAGLALALTRFPRTAGIGAMFGIVNFFVGGLALLGWIYGGPLVPGEVASINPLAAIAALVFGLGLAVSVGEDQWPARSFIGDSVHAILLRWFLPSVVALIIITDLVTVEIFTGVSPAVGSALNSVLSVIVTALTVSIVGRAIGRRLDAANAALRQSEERFRHVFENVPAGISVSDAVTGRLLYVNQEFARVYGYERDEMIGRTSEELGMWRNRAARGALLQALAQREGVREYELETRNKQGKDLVMRTAIARMHTEDGDVLVTASRDETARLRAEEDLRQAQKMDAIGKLAGGVAHDFNNLLTVIIGTGRLAMSQTEGALREEVSEMVDAAQRGADLTRQLLAFSRRQVLEPRLLDLNEIVDNSEKMLRRLIGQYVKIRSEKGENLGIVRADAGQIDQVLVNLVVNARDAMPDGGQILIRTANVDVDADFAQQHDAAVPGGYVKLSVSDTGTGMTPEVKERIFEPFFTTKEPGKGTGLGMPTVFGIVQQSGGFILIDSEPGAGTTVEIFLPRVEDVPERDRTAPASTLTHVPVSSTTLLLVEDERAIRRFARTVLQRAGYNVLEAADADEAQRIFSEHQADICLLVTDINMPGSMDGRALAETLKRSKRDLIVIFTSGSIEHEEAGELFLSKPYDPAHLLALVQQALA